MPKVLTFHAPCLRTSFALTLLMLLLSNPTPADSSNFRILNKNRQGERFNVTEYLAKSKINVIAFSSRSCPHCQALNDKLAELSQRSTDLVVSQLVIDRDGVQGIDWQSPLARQYELRSVPYFQVYDQTGKLLAEGEAARKMIAKFMLEAKVL